MKRHEFTTANGERLALHQTHSGMWCCPVCGSPEHQERPYIETGGGSFEICSCAIDESLEPPE